MNIALNEYICICLKIKLMNVYKNQFIYLCKCIIWVTQRRYYILFDVEPENFSKFIYKNKTLFVNGFARFSGTLGPNRIAYKLNRLKSWWSTNNNSKRFANFGFLFEILFYNREKSGEEEKEYDSRDKLCLFSVIY